MPRVSNWFRSDDSVDRAASRILRMLDQEHAARRRTPKANPTVAPPTVAHEARPNRVGMVGKGSNVGGFTSVFAAPSRKGGVPSQPPRLGLLGAMLNPEILSPLPLPSSAASNFLRRSRARSRVDPLTDPRIEQAQASNLYQGCVVFRKRLDEARNKIQRLSNMIAALKALGRLDDSPDMQALREDLEWERDFYDSMMPHYNGVYVPLGFPPMESLSEQ